MIEAIIFDFDGVLALTENVHFEAYEMTAKEFGRSLPEDFFLSMVGKTDQECATRLAKLWEDSIQEILRWKIEFYPKIVTEKGRLVPGIREFLEFLRSKNLPLAIATSSFRTDIAPILEINGWEDVFQEIRTIEDVENPKPHPEIYLNACRSLGVVPQNTLVFEDSPVGVQAARESGAQVIGMLTSFQPEDLGDTRGYWKDYTNRENWTIIDT